ncbi:hypothetical protein WBG78_15545 [Chryseolinea sp. T2]|uniref:hypothetical protein n=1 Tax=Chryseolinea sp. T2 TaxID=3129255 RepID=UPI00307693C0
MSEDIKFILNRFPSFKEEIIEAYTDNDEFKGLCEDIFTMTQTLERHERKLFSNQNHELEYRKLLLDLETELLKYLGKSRRT